MPAGTLLRDGLLVLRLLVCGGDGTRFGHGPHAPQQLPRHGPPHLGGAVHGRSVCAPVYRAGPGLAYGGLGSLWGGFPGGVGEAGALARGTDTPRRLHPARAGHGYVRLWAWPLVDEARPGSMPRAC